MGQANVLNWQVKLVLRSEHTDRPLLGGDTKLSSGGPTFLCGSEHRAEHERSDRSHPPSHFRANSRTGGRSRPVLLGNDKDEIVPVNGRPGRVLQKTRFSSQRGHVEDGYEPREQDDEETEADETEEHRGSDLGSRVEVLGEERAATVIVVE